MIAISIVLLSLIILGEHMILDTRAAACQEKLGMASGEIKNDQISASMFDGIYRPEKARFHGESAWCVKAKNGIGAFLEVDLGEIKRLTWIGNQGFGDGYVSNFTVQYKRRKTEKNWRNFVVRLPFNTSNIMTFKGNSDNTSLKFTRFKGSRPVRYLHFVILDGVGEKWCLRLEFYGCEWKNKDGLVSYRAAQGKIRGVNETAVTMNDATYDGTLEYYGRRFGVLHGGLGQLTDGDIGGDAFWFNMGNGKSFEWVGWYDLTNLKPSVLFEFNKPRRFHRISFHGNNRPGNVKIFRNLVVAFSVDGLYFSRKFVFYPSHSKTKYTNRSMWIDVDLQGHVGKFINCEFSYKGKWIVLSEVNFESEEFTGEDPHYTSLATPTFQSTKQQVYTPSLKLKPVERRPVKTQHILGLHAIIAMAVVGAALLFFTVVFIIWLTRIHQEEREGRAYHIRNVDRIVNSLKRKSLQRKGTPNHYTPSNESEEDIDDLMLRKTNNAVPISESWYKSLDRHKMNNMVAINDVKSWIKEERKTSNEKDLDNMELDV